MSATRQLYIVDLPEVEPPCKVELLIGLVDAFARCCGYQSLIGVVDLLSDCESLPPRTHEALLVLRGHAADSFERRDERPRRRQVFGRRERSEPSNMGVEVDLSREDLYPAFCAFAPFSICAEVRHGSEPILMVDDSGCVCLDLTPDEHARLVSAGEFAPFVSTLSPMKG